MYFKIKKRRRQKTGIGIGIAALIACLLLWTRGISDNFFIVLLDEIGEETGTNFYEKILQIYMPNVVCEAKGQKQETIAEYFVNVFFPLNSYVDEAQNYETQVESVLSYEAILHREGTDEYIPEENIPAEDTQPETEQEAAGEQVESGQEAGAPIQPETPSVASAAATEKAVIFPREKLCDFDYLLQNFYSVDSTTTIDSNKLNVEAMLGMDMSITHGAESPQILIYHTHSQEGYADSTPGDANTSVVAVGEYLAQILREQYGYNVIHDTGGYDVEDRDNAYTVAGPAVEQILASNPSIEVIIDLHRDGVAGTDKTITNINGNDMAKIMFFNGLSYTTSQGEIAYLANPNLAGNLAFSFRMQLLAAEYYPDYSKKIYLKGYRYNMHYLPKCTLVEVGNQNNTFAEAKNAMVPLADVLNRVLHNE